MLEDSQTCVFVAWSCAAAARWWNLASLALVTCSSGQWRLSQLVACHFAQCRIFPNVPLCRNNPPFASLLHVLCKGA